MQWRGSGRARCARRSDRRARSPKESLPPTAACAAYGCRNSDGANARDHRTAPHRPRRACRTGSPRGRSPSLPWRTLPSRTPDRTGRGWRRDRETAVPEASPMTSSSIDARRQASRTVLTNVRSCARLPNATARRGLGGRAARCGKRCTSTTLGNSPSRWSHPFKVHDPRGRFVRSHTVTELAHPSEIARSWADLRRRRPRGSAAWRTSDPRSEQK